MRRFWRIFAHAAGMWLERNAFVHAGSLAFYTLFSMAPVVIIAVTVAGAVFGQDVARGHIVTQLEDVLGRDAAQAVESAVEQARPDLAGPWPTLIGLGALLVGATTVFAQLQISLNRIWGVVSKPRKWGWLLLVRSRILSLAIILVIGFVLLVSLLLSVALRAIIRYADDWVPMSATVLTGAELGLSLVVITVLFAVMFKVLPDVMVDWRDLWFGAAVTAVLFTMGRYAIALYLAYAAPASAYGAAGSLVLVLLWVYYSSLILLFGAALTKARALSAGRPVVPRALAVRIREELVDEKGEAI